MLTLFINSKIRGKEFFKMVIFMPKLLSVIVVGFLFSLILNPTYGALNTFLKFVDLEEWARPWLGSPDTALYPIFLMIVSSLKSNMEILTSPLGLPHAFSFANYVEVWDRVNFGTYVWNSIYVSGLSVFFILFISSLAAFYLSRYSFRWNPYVLFFSMLGLMVPMKLAILPLYMIMLRLQLLDTLTSLVILYVAGGIPFGVFVFYGFFKTLPTELDQSARLDGCNGFQVYYKIILPLMKPALATVRIVHLIGVWNDFFYPLIFLKSEELSTIPLGVLTLFGEYDTEWNLLFASLTISSLPMIIAFLFASKQIIEGLTSGAIK